MPQLTFNKVILQSFSRKATGGTAHFKAALSAPVLKAMGWGDLGDWEKTVAAKGKLIASLIELKPKQSELSKHEISLDVQLIDGFQVARVEDTGKGARKTKSSKTVLSFKVHFVDVSGAKKLENYIQTCGESSMLAVYEKEPEQEELPGVDPTSEGQLELEEMVLDAKRRKATSKGGDVQ